MKLAPKCPSIWCHMKSNSSKSINFVLSRLLCSLLDCLLSSFDAITIKLLITKTKILFGHRVWYLKNSMSKYALSLFMLYTIFSTIPVKFFADPSCSNLRYLLLLFNWLIITMQAFYKVIRSWASKKFMTGWWSFLLVKLTHFILIFGGFSFLDADASAGYVHIVDPNQYLFLIFMWFQIICLRLLTSVSHGHCGSYLLWKLD